MKRACVYVLIWRHARRLYVGGTTHYAARLRWHRRKCRAARSPDARRSDLHQNAVLMQLATLYGLPEVEVLEDLPPGPLLAVRLAAAETRWIAWAVAKYGAEVVVNQRDPQSVDYAGA